jgi:hypothetical protein
MDNQESRYRLSITHHMVDKLVTLRAAVSWDLAEEVEMFFFVKSVEFCFIGWFALNM